MNPTTPKAQSLAFIQVGATGIVRTLMGVQFRIRHPVRPGSRSDKLATGRRPRSCARDIMPGLSLLLALSIPTGHAGANLDAKRVKEIAGWLPSQPAGVGQAITNRPAWEELARQAAFAPVVPAAERLAKSDVPALPDDLFLDYSRTGNRDRCQAVLSRRGERLTTFALAECLEDRGRFLTPLTNVIAALCAERTWVYPAHDDKLDSFYGRTTNLDLRATAVAWELATADRLLGDKLPGDMRKLIRDNVHRRVLRPFREMVEGRRKELGWMRTSNNWNAVCLAGIAGAALALEESSEERARFIVAVEYYIRNFLKGFTPDGYCSEGVGYWNYGFGHFVLMAETIREATSGHVDLLADPSALSAALFASRAEILNGIYPAIADCSPGTHPDEKIQRYLEERLALARPTPRGDTFNRPAGSLAATALLTFLPAPLPIAQRADRTGDSPLRTWFSDGGVLICRPTPGAKAEFAAALKGGHNAEQHNHNDVGSFSVIAGREMVLCDPGAEVYTARTFSAKRYDSRVLNSFGHAVPVIAGKLQHPGADARAVVLHADFNDDTDTLALDIRSAYAVPDLKQLERTFTFHRSSPTALTVCDDVAFSTPQTFETALITWGDWKKISDHEISVRDGDSEVRVTIASGGLPFEVRSETLDEDVRSKRKPVRIGIALTSPLEKATLTMRITPAPASAMDSR